MNDSESDPYESGQNSERSDISDDNDSHQETELHDNSDVISLEAESDGERFDPTEGENSFSLDGSMAAYCQKYFYQHLTEDSIKRNILDAAPVPANAFCTPPKVDDFVEDFIDFNAMKFLKMQDKSLTFIQKKIAQIMGPLAKIWQAVDGARKGQEENSEFTVLDMLKLVEQTVVLVGQANATCLYERRVNFLAKIMKGVKKAKEHLKTNEHDLSREKDVLYGETVFKALDRKSKSRKRAREISKEMQSKKRRIDQTSQPPFRAGPSRGYGNRGGRQSTWMSKQGSQSNRKPVQSNYKIPKKPRSGENRYENYQWYSSCYGTNNKNIKSEQPTCLSDTSQVQRNLSRQNTPRGKIRSISRKLGNDNKRSKLIGEYFRLQNRIQFRTNSEISTKTNKIIRTRNANSKFRNRGDVGQTGSGGCSDKNKLSVCQSFICTPQKRWGNETNIQSENSKPICSIQSLQNGGVSGSKKLDTEKGLVMQSRSEGCILLHTNMQRSQKVSKVSVQRTDATVQRTAIWTGIRSETFHKNNETSHCAIKTHRSPPCDLLRRHIVAKSITRRALKRQRHTLMVASQSRLVNKLEKISSNPMSATRISGSNNKFSGNGDNSISNQSREYQKKMYRHDQQNRSVNTRVIKFNRNTECYSRSCHPSLTVCEGASNVSNKMPAKIKKKLSTNDNTPTNFQRGDKLVATAAGTLEWKTNSTVLKPGLGDRNRCLENRVGGSMSHSELKNGGPWNPSEKKLHINVLELKAVQFAIQSLTKHKQNIHVHIKSDNTTVVAYLNKMGGTRSELLLQTTKQIWTHCLSKKIMITAEHIPGIQNVQADLESRQMRDTSNWMLNKGIFKQINQMWGPLNIDLFADRLNTQLENYMSWRPDPYAMGMDAFQIPWNNKRGYAFPPFCLITRCLSKVLKEKSEIVIITPAWQTQPYYPLLLTLSIDNPILLPPMKNLLLSPEGVVHPLVSNQTLKLVAWKVSGDKNKQQEFRNKLPNSWLQVGDKELRQLTTAAGDSGIAGVNQNKLIHFKPLWNM